MRSKTTAAICRQILHRHGLGKDLAAGTEESAARFVENTLALQPPWARIAVRLLTLAFALGALAFGGRTFARLPETRQRAYFAAWADSRLAPCRLLLRFYESLVLMSAHAPACARQPTSRSRPPATLPDRAHVVVIGSGPGGAMSAEYLAAAGRDVVLLEEGKEGPDPPPPPFSPEEMLERCRNGGVGIILGATPIAYMEGRGVGGGSEINSGFFHRTPPEMLARWREAFALAEAQPHTLAPHFAACEQVLGVQHFAGSQPAASERLAAGAAMLGWKVVRVPKWRSYPQLEHWQDDDRRPYHSMSRTLLPAFAAAGGKLVTQTRAHRLRRKAGGWEVELVRQGAREACIRADQVLVAAGAVQTPALLRRSGITRNVGESLALQPMLKVIAEFAEPVNSPGLGIGEHQVREFSPEMTFSCAVSSRAQLALGLARYPGASARLATEWERMAIYAVVLTGTGHGTVRALPGTLDPLVRYRMSRSEWQGLGVGLKRLGRLLFAAGALRLYPVLEIDAPIENPAALMRLPDDLSPLQPQIVTVHLTSSCPMGENLERCATDSFGAVHGASGLYIADASLLCSAPGVNPQGSIMAFARRNAAHLAACRSGR